MQYKYIKDKRLPKRAGQAEESSEVLRRLPAVRQVTSEGTIVVSELALKGIMFTKGKANASCLPSRKKATHRQAGATTS